MADKSRDDRVLDAINRAFQMLPDVNLLVADGLWTVEGLDLDDLTPVEIRVVLRGLARKKRIHLIEADGHAMIARDKKAAGANSPRVAAKPWKRISNGGI